MSHYTDPLPAGLSLADDGTLSGTPTASGAFTFLLTAQNTAGTRSSDSP